MPRMRVRVVCGRGETMATFSPRTRLRSVDFPTLGRPTMATKPALTGLPSTPCGLAAPRARRARGSRLRAAGDGDLLELRLGVPAAGDLRDELVARHHLAEDGVTAVEVRDRGLGDEELRAVRVRAGVRHGEQPGAVELVVGADLVREAEARPAVAGAERIAALDHEVRDDPVEDRPVVERALHLLVRDGVGPLLRPLHQAEEVLHRLGCLLGEELHYEVSGGGGEGGEELVGHGRGSESTRGLLAARLRLRDDDLLQRRLVVAEAGDLPDELAAAHALAEADVAAQAGGAPVALHRVEVERSHLRDEELRAVRVGARVRVGELAGLIEETLARFQLVRDGVAGAAHAEPQRI